MIQALLYLQGHSVKNRLIYRVKRLRQPKYLFGAIMGAAYFYFYFLRYVFGLGRPHSAVIGTDNAALFEAFGALALFTVLLLGWVIPRERAALSFTEAEVAFLFPAPITRRNLIHFKLLRSQAAIFFGSFILMLVTGRLGGHPWIRGVGWWMILSTLNLHLIGAGFFRTRLMDRGITTWQRRIGIVVVIGLVVTGIVIWARKTLPQADLASMENIETAKAYLLQLLNSGPARYLLLPLRLVIRPYLSTSGMEFIRAAGPALGIMLIHYLWVIRSDVAFEEASVDASRRLAERLAAARSGQWRGGARKFKPKRPPFELRPTGYPSVGFLWKNLISAGQGFSPRIWVSLLIMTVCFSFALRSAAFPGGLQTTAAMIAGLLLAWSLLLGPQLIRHDFRQDMPMIDVLKSYPLKGWQIALGEILAPALVLAAAQWLLLVLALMLVSPEAIHVLTLQHRLALGAGAAVLLPALDLVILQIPNAAVLLFPAWFPSGKDAPQGFEASGQRIIVMLGSLISCLICLIPAAIAFSVVYFLMQMATGPFAAFPVGCAAATLVLLAEAAGGIFLLGWLFERFDFSAET
jgi:ABC-2 type transport system permease protein